MYYVFNFIYLKDFIIVEAKSTSGKLKVRIGYRQLGMIWD